MDEHAIVLPSVAVQPGQDGTYVWVVGSDGKASSRKVTVLRTDGADTIIGSGVTAGESVVTDGQLRLTPGAAVSIKTGRGPS